MENRLTTSEDAIKLGLREEEFAEIEKILGRNPNITELSVFSAMWSEHCSYKNSIKYLKTLPKDGDHLLVKAGEENAGLVDLGGGIGCAFKIESHNHPSALEPYQGAATGVGGINRDIFTMGARPIAQMNSLRFGNIKSKRTKWLVKGVTKGIGDYGNSFGVPTVGGEIYFDETYEQNPLVNAFSAGIMHLDKQKIISSKASGAGNPVFIFGSLTGKDGINGAAFASKDLTEESLNDIPAVQVGDPFQEKKLLEATLELTQTDSIVGMQDMGAAGIICSTSEMSGGGDCGMKIWLDKVPLRQKNMLPFEILLSESQERMLAVLKKGKEQEAIEVFKKWDIHYQEIGEVIAEDKVVFYWKDKICAEVPAKCLVLGGGAPQYDREYKEPSYIQELKKFDIKSVEDLKNSELKTTLEQIVQLPNIASKKYLYSQYDQSVGTVFMGIYEPSDASLVNIKETNTALAMTVDCNSRYVYADPKIGTAIAVSEAARNIVCSGGEPSAITNNLNFGNPYDPEVYWQFVEAIEGLKWACVEYKTPVTGGNVSFYNQTVKNDTTTPICPTPTIGMIGIVKDKNKTMSIPFKKTNENIVLIGKVVDDINSSEYLRRIKKIEKSSVPYFDLQEEKKMLSVLADVISERLVSSAHDISEGGLLACLLEKTFTYNIGFEVKTSREHRLDSFLFGEGQGRVVVSTNQIDKLIIKLKSQNIPFAILGKTTEDESITIDNENIGKVEYFKSLYDNSLEKLLTEK